jgi:hypothetical protein
MTIGGIEMVLVREISQSALAIAVLTLGVVMLLELRSIARLRKNVERDMARVFEQLESLRLGNQQIIDVQSAPKLAPRLESPLGGERPKAEARLLSALHAARTQRKSTPA